MSSSKRLELLAKDLIENNIDKSSIHLLTCFVCGQSSRNRLNKFYEIQTEGMSEYGDVAICELCRAELENKLQEYTDDMIEEQKYKKEVIKSAEPTTRYLNLI